MMVLRVPSTADVEVVAEHATISVWLPDATPAATVKSGCELKYASPI
jgi:hypothetical protein